MVVKGIYIDEKGVKRCKYLGKKYPEGCDTCKHSIKIYCACDYEDEV